MVIFYSYINVYQRVNHLSCVINITLPILDTLQQILKFFAGERRYSHFHTKRLVRICLYPCKIDLDYRHKRRFPSSHRGTPSSHPFSMRIHFHIQRGDPGDPMTFWPDSGPLRCTTYRYLENLIYTKWGPQTIAKLVNNSNFTNWFMVRK